jgi:hypothetical protein
VQKLVEGAVSRAQIYVHLAWRRFQHELDGELLALDERLKWLWAGHRQTIKDFLAA